MEQQQSSSSSEALGGVILLPPSVMEMDATTLLGSVFHGPTSSSLSSSSASSDFVSDLLLSLALLSVGFFLVRDPSMSRKRQAWILSALTSMPAATLSLGHVHRLLRDGWGDVSTLVFQDDRLSRFLCTFFAAFLLLDLGLGLRCYPDQIHLLSGWVHHLAYLALMRWALTAHFSKGFCLFLPLELPTFILALGSIFPERRSDLLFGVTFLFTRVFYHALLLQRILRIRDAPLPVWIPTLLAFALHCYWFALWCRSYVRRRVRLEQDKSSIVVPASPTTARRAGDGAAVEAEKPR